MTHSHNLHARIGTINAARYLLINKSKELHIKIAKDHKDLFVARMNSVNDWEAFKEEVRAQSLSVKKDLIENPDNAESINQKKILKLQEDEIKIIDALIADGQLQKLWLAKCELEKNPSYAEYLNLNKALAENISDYQAVREARHIVSGSELPPEEIETRNKELMQKLSALEKQRKELEEKIKNLKQKSNFNDLLVMVELLEGTQDDLYFNHQGYELIGKNTEGGVEIFSSVDDMIDQSIAFSNQLDALGHAQRAGEAVSRAAVSSIEFLQSIIVVNNFIRGLVYLQEAYSAFKNSHEPQRKTKIGAGLFGGLISIGASVIGILLLAGAGLMATGAAIYAAPIAIAAAVVGVYAATLYRDSYVLHQARAQVQKMQNEISKVDAAIQEKSTSEHDSDPALARLHLQKANLEYSLNILSRSCQHVRNKNIASGVAFAAVSLVLVAACITGVGALVLGVVSAAVLIGTTAARIYQERKDKKEKMAALHAHQLRPRFIIESEDELVHSSELDIEKKLLRRQGRERDLANVLRAAAKSDENVEKFSGPSFSLGKQSNKEVSPLSPRDDDDRRGEDVGLNNKKPG